MFTEPGLHGHQSILHPKDVDFPLGQRTIRAQAIPMHAHLATSIALNSEVNFYQNTKITDEWKYVVWNIQKLACDSSRFSIKMALINAGL